MLARSIVGETILVPIKGAFTDMRKLFALNPVAEVIWRELNGEKTLLDISRRVEAEFEVDPDQALIDVEEFATTLAEAGLIEELK